MNRRGFFNALAGCAAAAVSAPSAVKALIEREVVNPRRLYNYWRSANSNSETIMLSAKEPWIGSAAEFISDEEAVQNASVLMKLIPKMYDMDWINHEEVRRRLDELG